MRFFDRISLTTLILATTFVVACSTLDVSSRPIAIREAFREQKVVVGMYPGEAHAVAGSFDYSVAPDRSVWGDAFDPVRVIFAQRHRPDDSEFVMMFRNRTQYDSSIPLTFTVAFRKGKAWRIVSGFKWLDEIDPHEPEAPPERVNDVETPAGRIRSTAGGGRE